MNGDPITAIAPGAGWFAVAYLFAFYYRVMFIRVLPRNPKKHGLLNLVWFAPIPIGVLIGLVPGMPVPSTFSETLAGASLYYASAAIGGVFLRGKIPIYRTDSDPPSRG